MRPPELAVSLVLYELECAKTEDSGDGDEPYLWVLGFKVDAETLGPPTPDFPLLPSLNVRVFEGPPHFRHIVGGNSIQASTVPIPIPPAMGARDFRLKPANLPLVGWFPGLCGIICLLWDEDGWDPETSEEAFTAFRSEFGPALSDELNKLMQGDYDDTLSRNANNQVVPGFEALSIEMRLARLGDAEVRKRAVKAMKDAIVPRIREKIEDAVTIGLDELDTDDLLGAEVQVYLGNELRGLQTFSLHYTEDEADYTIRGRASGQSVRLATLESVVTNVVPERIDVERLWLQVCFHEPQEYHAFAIRQKITTRFELRNIGPEAPSAVRWFLDGNLLPSGDGTISVTFEPVAEHEGPPEDVLAPYYTGGPGILRSRVVGSVLEITNDHANGVFLGKVTALYAYPGDPQLTDKLDSGYTREADIGIVALDLVMGWEYYQHVRECAKTIESIDRKRIKAMVGKPIIDPGDPPPYREYLEERVIMAAQVARAVNLQVLTQPGREMRTNQQQMMSIPKNGQSVVEEYGESKV